MVVLSEQQNTVLIELHDWLKEQWPIKQALSKHQHDHLTQICRKIFQQHQHYDQHYIGKNKIHSQPGFEQEQFHSGFLFMGQQSATPLHDHAESFALSLLLSGAANISIYQRVEKPQSDLSHLVFKEMLPLQPGNFTSLPADNTLIHKLSTTSQTACLLDIHYPQFSSNQRYWYLPITSDDKQMACQRIAERKFSTNNM